MHKNDELLRREGFKIDSRPEGLQPLWRDAATGEIINQEAALRIARQRREKRCQDAAAAKARGVS